MSSLHLPRCLLMRTLKKSHVFSHTEILYMFSQSWESWQVCGPQCPNKTTSVTSVAFPVPLQGSRKGMWANSFSWSQSHCRQDPDGSFLAVASPCHWPAHGSLGDSWSLSASSQEQQDSPTAPLVFLPFQQAQLIRQQFSAFLSRPGIQTKNQQSL